MLWEHDRIWRNPLPSVAVVKIRLFAQNEFHFQILNFLFSLHGSSQTVFGQQVAWLLWRAYLSPRKFYLPKMPHTIPYVAFILGTMITAPQRCALNSGSLWEKLSARMQFTTSMPCLWGNARRGRHWTVVHQIGLITTEILKLRHLPDLNALLDIQLG